MKSARQPRREFPPNSEAKNELRYCSARLVYSGRDLDRPRLAGTKGKTKLARLALAALLLVVLILGLTPQALRWRPLCGLTRSLPLPVLMTSLLRRLDEPALTARVVFLIRLCASGLTYVRSCACSPSLRIDRCRRRSLATPRERNSMILV
jgi:hypothetical protein